MQGCNRVSIQLFVSVPVAALLGLSGAARAGGNDTPPLWNDEVERDVDHETVDEHDDLSILFATRYSRIGTEHGARVALETELFGALELSLAAGYDEDRLSVRPGERRPDEREIELSAGWTLLEHDAGFALGLVLENAWTRADDGLFQEEDEVDEQQLEVDIEPGEADEGPESAVERGTALHLGVVTELEFGDRVVAAVEWYRERVDGDGSAVSVTGYEIGMDVTLVPRLSVAASAARLRATGEATEYSLGLSWQASERVLFDVEGSRRTAEPDKLTFGIELRLR